MRLTDGAPSRAISGTTSCLAFPSRSTIESFPITSAFSPSSIKAGIQTTGVIAYQSNYLQPTTVGRIFPPEKAGVTLRRLVRWAGNFPAFSEDFLPFVTEGYVFSGKGYPFAEETYVSAAKTYPFVTDTYVFGRETYPFVADTYRFATGTYLPATDTYVLVAETYPFAGD